MTSSKPASAAKTSPQKKGASIVTGAPSADVSTDIPTALKPGQKRCYYCGAIYSLGEPEGETLIRYPQAEYRYWGHCLTNQHQMVMQHLDRTMAELLKAMPEALRTAKQDQKQRLSPLFAAVKGLLK